MALMNHTVKTVECFTHSVMNSTLWIIQLNVQKQSSVQLSLMNNSGLQYHNTIAVSKHYVWRVSNKLITTLIKHANWIKLLSTTQSENRWAVRSMLWIHKNVKAEQVLVDFYNLMTAVLYLQEYMMLIVSIYILCNNEQTLIMTMHLINKLINDTRRKALKKLQILLLSNFNCHNQL